MFLEIGNINSPFGTQRALVPIKNVLDHCFFNKNTKNLSQAWLTYSLASWVYWLLFTFFLSPLNPKRTYQMLNVQTTHSKKISPKAQLHTLWVNTETLNPDRATLTVSSGHEGHQEGRNTACLLPVKWLGSRPPPRRNKSHHFCFFFRLQYEKVKTDWKVKDAEESYQHK